MHLTMRLCGPTECAEYNWRMAYRCIATVPNPAALFLWRIEKGGAIPERRILSNRHTNLFPPAPRARCKHALPLTATLLAAHCPGLACAALPELDQATESLALGPVGR